MAGSKKVLKLLKDSLDKTPSVMAGPSVVEKKLLVPVEQGFEDVHIAERLRRAEEARDAMKRLGLVSPEAAERSHVRRLRDITQEASTMASDDDYVMALKQKQALESKGIKSVEDANELERYKQLLEMIRRYK